MATHSSDPLLVAARRVWHGPAKSSLDAQSVQFALCFENSILKGWVTEKIFDCLFTGTIPIYLGAPEICGHVPAECFIDMRTVLRLRRATEVPPITRRAGDIEVQAKREDYLQSDRFRPFSRTRSSISSEESSRRMGNQHGMHREQLGERRSARVSASSGRATRPAQTEHCNSPIDGQSALLLQLMAKTNASPTRWLGPRSGRTSSISGSSGDDFRSSGSLSKPEP